MRSSSRPFWVYRIFIFIHIVRLFFIVLPKSFENQNGAPLYIFPHRKTPPRGHPERRSDRATPRSPQGDRVTDAVGSRDAHCSHPSIFLFSVCAHKNSSITYGKLSVIVHRSLRRAACGSRLDFLPLTPPKALFDCKKLRELRTLRMTNRMFICRYSQTNRTQNSKFHRINSLCSNHLCTLPLPSPPASFSTSETDTRL